MSPADWRLSSPAPARGRCARGRARRGGNDWGNRSCRACGVTVVVAGSVLWDRPVCEGGFGAALTVILVKLPCLCLDELSVRVSLIVPVEGGLRFVLVRGVVFGRLCFCL